MPTPSRLAVVEDNPTQQMILVRLLQPEYTVTAFDNGDAFLKSQDTFDAVLLDIEMPGPNGYDTCRTFRERGSDAPVIFVSAHDTAPERVAAYEAGGDDFVIKPIAADELQHKVRGALDHRHRLKDMAHRSSEAQKVAFAAMSSMGELGVVVEFLRQTTLCKDYCALGTRLLEAMTAWELRGAIQIRGRNGTENLSTAGRMTPLQLSVLENLRDMGRIFEMGARAVVNFEHVSLLVENLPVDDPRKLGRQREHLAVLAESMDKRIQGMDALNERDLQKVGIDGALAELRHTLNRLGERRQQSRNLGHFHMVEALELLAKTIGTLGLSDSQREYVDDLVKCTMDDTNHYFTEAADLDTEFADVLIRLERLSTADYRL